MSRAPNDGVQVIVVQEPPPDPFPVAERFTNGIVGCNRLKPTVRFYTGVDSYDPLAYGKSKSGTMMERPAYDAIWARAYGDH